MNGFFVKVFACILNMDRKHTLLFFVLLFVTGSTWSSNKEQQKEIVLPSMKNIPVKASHTNIYATPWHNDFTLVSNVVFFSNEKTYEVIDLKGRRIFSDFSQDSWYSRFFHPANRYTSLSFKKVVDMNNESKIALIEEEIEEEKSIFRFFDLKKNTFQGPIIKVNGTPNSFQFHTYNQKSYIGLTCYKSDDQQGFTVGTSYLFDYKTGKSLKNFENCFGLAFYKNLLLYLAKNAEFSQCGQATVSRYWKYF